MKKSESAKSAKEIVMEFIEALERKDFKTVRSYMSDNISFNFFGRKHKCAKCGKKFKDEAELLEHNRTAHSA